MCACSRSFDTVYICGILETSIVQKFFLAKFQLLFVYRTPRRARKVAKKLCFLVKKLIEDWNKFYWFLEGGFQNCLEKWNKSQWNYFIVNYTHICKKKINILMHTPGVKKIERNWSSALKVKYSLSIRDSIYLYVENRITVMKASPAYFRRNISFSTYFFSSF